MITHTETGYKCKLAAYAKAARHARSASRGHISHYRCRSALRLHLKCWQIKRFLILMYFFIIFSCFLFCKFVFFFSFQFYIFFYFPSFLCWVSFFSHFVWGILFCFCNLYILYVLCCCCCCGCSIYCMFECVWENHCAAIENNLICKLL